MSFEAMNFKRKVRACHCPYNIKPRIGRCALFGYQEMPKGGMLKLQNRSSLEGGICLLVKKCSLVIFVSRFFLSVS